MPPPLAKTFWRETRVRIPLGGGGAGGQWKGEQVAAMALPPSERERERERERKGAPAPIYGAIDSFRSLIITPPPYPRSLPFLGGGGSPNISIVGHSGLDRQ